MASDKKKLFAGVKHRDVEPLWGDMITSITAEIAALCLPISGAFIEANTRKVQIEKCP